MALNIKHFLLALLGAAVAALFLLEPYHVSYVDKKGVPQVVFEGFESYEIGPRKVESRLEGRRAKKFGQVLIVEEANLTRIAPHGVDAVRADRAVVRPERSIELKGGVVLARSDGWKMKAPRLHYDIRRRFYTTRGAPFVITYGESVVHGKALRYYQKSGKIRAKSIRARIAQKDL